MALRDYLNVESRQDLRQFVLQNGQAVAVVIMNELNPVPLETWYFKADSLSSDNNTSVIRPNAISADQPGRYILNTTEADWNLLKNKPNLATVATTGNYNDLNNKITAGIGVLLQNNELKVDDSKFLTVAQSNQNLGQIQAELNNKLSNSRTITVNGITQDLSTNRSWEVGDISSAVNYINPNWITSLNSSKITGLSNVAKTGLYTDLSSKPNIPSKTSDLSNDSGFLTTVPAQSWTSITGKPSFSNIATTGDYSDLTNKPTIPTNNNQLTNGSGYLTSVPAQTWESIVNKPSIPKNTNDLVNNSGFITTVPAQSFSSLTDKPTNLSGYGIVDAYPLNDNPKGFLSTVPAQSWTSITGKPSFSSVATTGKYSDLSESPVIPSNTNQLTNGAGFITSESDPTVPSHVKTITTTNLSTWNGKQDTIVAGTGILKTGNTLAIDDTNVMTVGSANASIATLNTQISGKVPNTRKININGVEQDLSSDRTWTVTANIPTKVFSNTAVKTINGTGVQLSTTRDASVSYTITHTIALTLVLTTGSTQVFLEISSNNSTWTPINQTGYSDGVSVAVALTKSTTGNLQGIVPAGYYVRLRSVVTGAGSTTYVSGQEVLL